MVPIPANMTHIFQPLYLTVSKAFLRKTCTQTKFENSWRREWHHIKVDVRQRNKTTACCLGKKNDHMRSNPDIVLNGWKQSGITTEALSKEAD